MAYCVHADISSEFKGITFSTTTAVTANEVTEFIAQADAEINSRLSVKYQTPITGTEALAVVKSISIALVSARVRGILEVKTGGDSEKQDGGRDSAKDARALLDKLASGKAKLTDATLASSHDGVKSYNYPNDIEATFDATSDQW